MVSPPKAVIRRNQWPPAATSGRGGIIQRDEKRVFPSMLDLADSAAKSPWDNLERGKVAEQAISATKAQS